MISNINKPRALLMATTALAALYTSSANADTELQSQIGAMPVSAIESNGEAPPAAQGEATESDVEQITVHGAKNTTSYQDTLSSVGLVTAQDIADKELRSFREAFRTLGNVLDADFVDGGFILRGVNSEGLTPGGSPLAALYVDGAQQTTGGARRGARGLWDVEQVEVYRGPQSTLAGRASLAGAIYVKTKDPTYEWDAAARATFGTSETMEGAVAFGGPIIEDQVAFRVAAEYIHAENQQIDYPTWEIYDRHDDFIEDEYYQIRGKVLVTPEGAPNTKALLTYSFSHDSPPSNTIAGPGNGFELSEYRGDFGSAADREVRSATNQSASLEITHDFSDALTFTSITAVAATKTARPSINEGTAGETFYAFGRQEQTLVSQELRLNYDSGPWKNVIGLYANYEDGDFISGQVGFFDSNTAEDTTNLAIFGETSYEFVPSWRVVVGGRLDHISYEEELFGTLFGFVVANSETEIEETNFLPKIGLVKEIGDNHTLGFVAQQGFRTGGGGLYFTDPFFINLVSYSYDSEFTWNYEASYKGSFANGRGSLSANVFYTDWKDQQVEVDPFAGTGAIGTTFVTNAASSDLYGAELETRYAFTEAFSGFASIGYLNTEFKDFEFVGIDATGLPFPEAPEWNLAFGGTYEHASGAFFGADTKYVSEHLARIAGLPHDYLDSYWVANAQIGYRTERFDVTLFSENLFDEEYYVYRNSVGTPAVDVSASVGAERLVAGSITVRF